MKKGKKRKEEFIQFSPLLRCFWSGVLRVIGALNVRRNITVLVATGMMFAAMAYCGAGVVVHMNRAEVL